MHGIIYHIEKEPNSSIVYDEDEIFGICEGSVDYVDEFSEKQKNSAIELLKEALLSLCGNAVSIKDNQFFFGEKASENYVSAIAPGVRKFCEEVLKDSSMLASPLAPLMAENAFSPYSHVLVVYGGEKYTFDGFIRLYCGCRDTFTIIGAFDYHY